VFITRERQYVVGSLALARGQSQPDRLYVNFKRDLGNTVRSLDGQVVTGDQLAVQVIQTLLEHPRALGYTHFTPVVCHPAGMDWELIMAGIMQNAGPAAILLSEPEAALYYAHQRSFVFTEKPETVLLVDFGGGTCDFLFIRVNAVEWKGITRPSYEFIGDDRIDFGGQDIDRMIRDKLAADWVEGHPALAYLAHRLDQPDMDWKLMERAKSVKEQLSNDYQRGFVDQVLEIEVDGLPRRSKLRTQMTPNHLCSLSKDEIQRNFREVLLDRTESPGALLYRKGSSPEQVTLVLLAGGSSNLPWVEQQVLPTILPTLARAHRIKRLPEPEMAVAYGAALYAADVGEGQPRIPRFLQEDLKLVLGDDRTVALVDHGTPLPVSKSDRTGFRIFSFPETGTTLTVQLAAGKGHRASDCRKLSSEPKKICFDSEIQKGTKMEIRTEIDRKGTVHLHIAKAGPHLWPFGGRDKTKTVLFEPLRLTR
jgi:molecular chaperone DnaK (HSP70)